MTPNETAAVLRATDWMLAAPAHTPALLAAVLRLELPDPFAVATDSATRATQAGELVALANAHPNPWPGDPALLLSTIGKVGAQAWLQDPENVADWDGVAIRAEELATAAKGWPYRSTTNSWAKSTGPQTVAAFLDAGRGPTYANDILTAAERAQLAPDAFGYGEGITPAVLVALAAAGVYGHDDLKPYLAVGLSVADAIKFAERQVTSRAVHWAAHSGLPVEQWELLAGMPSGWFPSTSESELGRGGLVSYGYTVDDLRFLLEHGWGSISGGTASHGLNFGPRRQTTGLTAAVARQLAAVCPKDEFEAWVAAMTTGKSGTGVRDAALPPLMRSFIGDLTTFTKPISDLLEAGLRPSHLNTYRAAGCRSVADVLSATTQGVTPKRVKVLLELKGARTATYRPLRLANLTALLAAHRDVPADAVASERVDSAQEKTATADPSKAARPSKATS